MITKEALTIDPENHQDIHSKAETILLRKLLTLKNAFPFLTNFDKAIRGAMDKTGVFFQNNDIPDNTQNLWTYMIKDFATAINSLGMIGVSYAISRKEDSNVNELKQKAIAKFNSSAPIPELDKKLNQLKQAGVDTGEYERILEEETQNIMQNIFDLDAEGLNKFSLLLDINPAMKSQISKIINTNRNILTRNTQKQTAMTMPAKGLARTMTPEIAQQLSDGFKKYMETLNSKYGSESLQLLNQEIQNYMRSQTK